MKTDTALILVLVLGGAFCIALWVLGGCYHCKAPDCSDLPPEPSPWVETVAKDASREH